MKTASNVGYGRYQTFLDNLRFSFFLLQQRKTPLVGLVIIVLLLLTAVFAPWLAPYEIDQYAETRISPPSRLHFFGVDHLGRDQFSRVVYGSRVSLRVGVTAVGLSLAAGSVLGLISGYFGRFLDNIIMRAMDVVMALPYVLLAILIAAVLGPSLENAVLAIGIVHIPRFARLARGSTLSVKEQQFVEASRSVGVSDFRIVQKDILPNILGPLIVYATLSLGDAIIGAAILSFLGLGAQPPIPEWGAMLNEAQKFIIKAPYLSIFPGMAIFLTVLGFNLFGDGLRDIPRPKITSLADHMETLIDICDLVVNFYTYRGVVKALDGITLAINRRESVGLVGETGCGKSVTARSIIRLVDAPGRIEGGHVFLEGRDLLTLPEPEMRSIRGRQISFVFQEPRKALDPTCTVGKQMEEAIQIALGVRRREARDIGLEILRKVGLADGKRLMKSYSFELSGGMAQRVLIGMAICGKPKLIVADEPTSAVDVSVQAQLLRLLKQLYEEFDSSLLLITHNLGVAAENCERIAVMYAGRIVEHGPVEAVFRHPAHPYTVKLFQSLPTPESKQLVSIPGMVPDLIHPPPGCRFSNRCDMKAEACVEGRPPLREIESGHFVACHTQARNPRWRN